MSIFLDTSGFLSVIDADDRDHENADRVWKDLLSREEAFYTSNYVLLETYALLQNRLGIEAVQTFTRDIVPILTIHWVGESEHNAGVAAVLGAGRRRLGLVDCVSFEIMNRLGIKRCFGLDPNFGEQGFEVIP